MRILLIILIFSSGVVFGEEKVQCEARLDAALGNVEVYRNTYFDSHIKVCIPSDSSFVKLKELPEKHAIAGFVVGIESFYNQIGEVIKLTSKAGAHTTVVRLYKKSNDGLALIPNAEFSSSMSYIVVSVGGTEVRTRESHMGKCRWVMEEKFKFKNGAFISVGTSEVDRDCT